MVYTEMSLTGLMSSQIDCNLVIPVRARLHNHCGVYRNVFDWIDIFIIVVFTEMSMTGLMSSQIDCDLVIPVRVRLHNHCGIYRIPKYTEMSLAGLII